MSEDNVPIPPPHLGFGELLRWHLRHATRSPNSGLRGTQWGITEFANEVGFSDRQVRNWLDGKSLPRELAKIEEKLFGRDPNHRIKDRQQLWQAFEAAREQEPKTLAASRASKPAYLSNIPITVPRHFLGRGEALDAIDEALKQSFGRVAITALHGLRGVGKTMLAVAYTDFHRTKYRATWWIRAQTLETMRADLIALGVRLGWIAAGAKDDEAVAPMRERLGREGKGLLLVYDNAIDAKALLPFLPPGGAARVIITSNSHDWRKIAAPVEIQVWPKGVGADYLVARTGREGERAEAEALSEALGGLPLAHEQAAAYCARLEIPLGEYQRRFDAEPTFYLDDERHTPVEHNGGQTVTKAFTLAIDEAAKIHPAAEQLLVYSALLAPEPIPLFLFAEAREKIGEPMASQLASSGLDEAIAALRALALVNRETILDERDPTIKTETIRLHQLVRIAVAARCQREAVEASRRVLLEAMAAVYPSGVSNDPSAWPRARRLDAHAFGLVASLDEPPIGKETATASLLIRLASYRQELLADYSAARPLFVRALAIYEKTLGPEHSDTAKSLNELAGLLRAQGDLAGARPLYERALAIHEKAFGPEHDDIATGLNNLAGLLRAQGDLAGAGPLYERALAIREKTLGPEHPETATSLNNLASLLAARGDLAGARRFHERALAIREKALGFEHPLTATSLNNLAGLLRAGGDHAGAQSLYERALAIYEKTLGPEHPDAATSLNNLASLLRIQGDLVGARLLFNRALGICEKALGPEHPDTALILDNLASLLLQAQGDPAGARPLHERALAIREKALGPGHPDTATSLDNLASLLRAQGDLAGARPLCDRALAIREKALGPEHAWTAKSLDNLACLLQAQGDLSGARVLFERAVAIYEKALGAEHAWTAISLDNLAGLLWAQGDLGGARLLCERALAIREKALAPQHTDTATSLSHLASLLQAQGDLAGAQRLLERALTIREKALAPEHPDIAASLNSLAGLLQAQGDLAGARLLLERAPDPRKSGGNREA